MDWIWFGIVVLIIMLAERITEKRISTLQVHFDYMASNVRNQRQEISALKGQLNNAFSTLGRLTSKFTGLQNNLERKISDLRNNMDRIRSTSHAQPETSYSQPETNISTVQSQMETIISVLHKKLKKEVSTLQNKFKNDMSDLDDRMQTLRSTSTDELESQISILQNKWEEKKSVLQAQLDTMNSKSNSQIYSLENKISGLQTQVENIRAITPDQLNTKISTLKNAQKGTTAELETKLGQVNVKLSDLQNALETTSSDLLSRVENILYTCLDQLDSGMSVQVAQQATSSDLQQKSTDAQTVPVVSFDVRGAVGCAFCLKDTTIQFQEVINNIEGAYNPDTGVFICPVSGIYHLSVSLHILQDRTGCVTLYAGSQTKRFINTKESSSFSGQLHLKAGDNVYVKTTDAIFLSGDITSFSGHLIRKL